MVDPRRISHEDGLVCIDFAENFEGFEKGVWIEKDPEDEEERQRRRKRNYSKKKGGKKRERRWPTLEISAS